MRSIASGEGLRSKLWFAALLNLAVLLALLLLFCPEPNVDDIGIMGLVSGAKGAYEPHAIYIHIAVGWLLMLASKLAPAIPWFLVYQWALLYCALTLLTHVLLRAMGGRSNLWIVLLFLFIVCFRAYIGCTYTQTTGIVAAVGLAILTGGGQTWELKPWMRTAALVLTLLSAMLRFQQFLAVSGVLSALGLCRLLQYLRLSDPRRRRRVFAYVGFFAALFTLCLGLHAVDRACYTSPEWKHYEEHNAYRTELMDHGLPSFEENREALAELGIDETTFRLMRRGVYSDTERLSMDVLRKVIAMKRKPRIGARYLLNFVLNVGKHLAHESYTNCLLLFLLCFICWLLRGRKGGAELASVAYMLLVLAGMYFYLYYCNRYRLIRVDTGLWFGASLVMLSLCDGEGALVSRRAGAALLALCVLATLWFQRESLWIRSFDEIEKRDNRRAAMAEIARDDAHLYIVNGDAPILTKSINVWDSPRFGESSNMYSLMGWSAETPPNRAILERFDVRNPLREMVDSDSMYLCTNNHLKSLLAYAQTWYDEPVVAEYVRSIEGFAVYRFVRGK